MLPNLIVSLAINDLFLFDIQRQLPHGGELGIFLLSLREKRRGKGSEGALFREAVTKNSKSFSIVPAYFILRLINSFDNPPENPLSHSPLNVRVRICNVFAKGTRHSTTNLEPLHSLLPGSSGVSGAYRLCCIRHQLKNNDTYPATAPLSDSILTMSRGIQKFVGGGK